MKAILTPVLRFFYRVRVEGLDNVPADGAAILAGNHLAVCDSFFLPLALRRRITFVAKAEYFEDPKTAWFFRAAGQIPIKRDGGSSSERALESAREVLEAGGLFGIYPEGTRSPDGRLYKGHTGVARLALQEAQTIGRAIPRFFMPITIKIGAPMNFERYADRVGDPKALRQITDEIMFELRELSGQEYVDSYAVRKGSLAAAEPARVATAAEALAEAQARTDKAREELAAVAG